MVILSKKSPPMSHPLNTEIMETKRHQGVGIITRRGHGPKRPKNEKNEEFLVKRGEEDSKNGCWLEGELKFKKTKNSRMTIMRRA
jgi:hypothetical protein